ncbi:ribonuclease H-like domain-containing protein [Echria macrotheca]|uniref:Ribonuclease H-like domain-containing protein n=1 Tax=Echria macrotheca TaxID=438768 RepID=A0AAJ0BK73_9PEZI|nr:ribonuclease H-like domain-containing protein [Echria macrotheca]
MWYQNWERNNWMKAGRDPVMNQDLIKAIRARIEARDEKGTKTQFVWVKGHASDPGNHAADALANEGARKL